MKKISFLFGMLATCITLQAAVEEISVSRALEIISGLADGASTTEQYIVKGVVSEIITTDEGLVTYKNCDFWMSDSDNATLKIKAFRTKGIAGADFTVGLIAVGDTVKVQGVLMHYVNTTTSEELLEIYKGNLVEVSNAIYYKFDDANLTAAVTYRGSSASAYNEYTGDVVIPATVTYGGNTYSVTSIGDFAFAYCSGLTSVTIPNSVTSIGSSAFKGCSGLTSVTIGNSVTNIGDEAFSGCSGLTSVTIGNSVRSIGTQAFWNCSGLTSITIPNSVISIGNDAFGVCEGLTSVTIGNSVESIGYYAFGDCANLTSIIIPNSVITLGHSVFYRCSGLTSVVIGSSVESIGHSAFYGCSSLTSVTWNAQNCEDFAEYYDEYYNYHYGPFYEIASQITSFTFGSEVEHIPAYLCYGMENLTSVTIPNSVTSIGSYAFSGCSGLTSVTIPNSVTSIGSDAFAYCSGLTKTNYTGDIAGWCGINFEGWNSNPTAYSHNLYINDVEVKDLVIPNSVTSIGNYAFRGCSGLTSVTIPNSVTSIGEDAFAECSGLTSVTIPNSVTSIGVGAFTECSGLTSVTIPNSVTSIGGAAFAGCSGLTSVTIPNSVTSIGGWAFAECSSLTSVTIGNSVTSIEEGAFYECSGLTSVTIGNSVTSIGVEAFYGCTKLINIVCYAAEPPSCEESVFANYNVFLKVPCNNLMAYQTHVCWGSFKYISCIGSEEVQVTEFSVTPSTNEAQFTWPAEPNAATYELVISKDGVVFCTLTFNASGQLMGIAFAPGANTAATTATSGFQFTVTGLDEASHYTYTFDAKDAGGSVVKHYAGEFNTDGFVGLGQIELAGLYTQAGRIVCEGEFRIYDLLGRDVTRLNGSLCGVYVVKTANAAVKVVVK